MKQFKKGNVTGFLKLVIVEKITSKGRAYFTGCLTLVDSEGNWLTPCETFRSNAHKKAALHFKQNGWEVL